MRLSETNELCKGYKYESNKMERDKESMDPCCGWRSKIREEGKWNKCGLGERGERWVCRQARGRRIAGFRKGNSKYLTVMDSPPGLR